jgi:glycyl-tRNA synthetase
MIKKTLGAAVKEGTIANETLAYFIGRTALFLLKAGIKMEHLRFRCNLI